MLELENRADEVGGDTVPQLGKGQQATVFCHNAPGVTPLLSRPQPDTGWRSLGTGTEPRVW